MSKVGHPVNNNDINSFYSWRLNNKFPAYLWCHPQQAADLNPPMNNLIKSSYSLIEMCYKVSVSFTSFRDVFRTGSLSANLDSLDIYILTLSFRINLWSSMNYRNKEWTSSLFLRRALQKFRHRLRGLLYRSERRGKWIGVEYIEKTSAVLSQLSDDFVELDRLIAKLGRIYSSVIQSKGEFLRCNVP